jgi:flagellar hook-associated protein 1 FlgK
MSSTVAARLSNLQPVFDLQSTTGIAGSLNSLFSAFSQLTVSPNDAQSRQSVLSAASGLASAFNVASNGLDTATTTVDSAVQSTVQDFNSTLTDLQNLNIELRRQASSSTPDPSLDARLHVDLETLSQYAGVSSLRQQDGSVSVFLGGQKPLLIGSTQYQIKAVSSGSGTVIQDSNGTDITSAVSGGQLGALLQIRNSTLPSYQTQLDQMAQSVASVVNTQLAAGVDQHNNPGAALFSFNVAGPAHSLAVTSITGDQLAVASPSSPSGNDNAIALSGLQNNTVAALGNFTLTQYYGNLSSSVGRDISNAQNNSTTQQQLLAQAQSLRSTSSSVSLDEEAARLVQYQQVYEATSKLISVIDNMTQTLLGLIPTASA